MGWWEKHETEEDEVVKGLVRHASQLHGVPTREVVDTVLDRNEDEDEAEEELDDEDLDGKHKRGHAGLWVTLAMVAAVFGGGVWWLLHLAGNADNTAPLAGTGEQQIQKSLAPTPAINPTFTSQYISFSYPSLFDTVSTVANWPNTIERIAIGSKRSYKRSIQVYVEKDLGGLEGDSSYKFRSINPSTYTPQPIKVGADAGVVMVKSDRTERTLYLVHADKILVMSLTSSDGSDDLASFVGVIQKSIKWVAS